MLTTLALLLASTASAIRSAHAPRGPTLIPPGLFATAR